MVEGVQCVGQLLFAVGFGGQLGLGHETCFVVSLVDDDDRAEGGGRAALCDVG